MKTILRTLAGISTFAFAASASPAVSATCGAPLSGWKTARPAAAQVVNTVSLLGHSRGANAHATHLTWNGSSASPEQVRVYLGLVRLMNPVPTLVLVVSPSVDCAEVSAFRQMIDETLDCETGQCVEVSS